jgi:rRNA maturation RNase YbeY
MIVNSQKQYAMNSSAVRVYVRRLKRVLRLERRDFNVCFVNDREIERLNARYLGRPRATDVLAFPWQDAGFGSHGKRPSCPVPGARRRFQGRKAFFEARYGPCRGSMPVKTIKPHRRRRGDPWLPAEFRNLLGDVVISVQTARRNARREGHSTLNEIRWLILHGVLHLLGFDHERDRGEMTRQELALREQLGIAGSRGKK